MDYIDEYRLFDLAWEGRNLVYLGESVAGELDIYYEYNDEGIRTSKTVADTEYKYTLNGSQIVSQEWDNKLIIFFYDETGSPIGYGYRTTSMTANTFYYYVYEKNLQGDIVAIYNTSGTKLISYTYDAWGNVSVSNINISGTNAGAQYNPFRYRGYYYDEEVRLYYLNSRYYDPRTGRFINADGYVSTGTGVLGYNMYAYCNNNPVMRVDPIGDAWYHWALGAVVVVGCAIAVVATAGGAAAAIAAVAAVGNGVAAATAASTVAASAFIGASTAYASAALLAAYSSNSIDEFNDQGNWGTVASTSGGGLFGAAYGYLMARAQLPKSSNQQISSGVSSAPEHGAIPNSRYLQYDQGTGQLRSDTVYNSSGDWYSRVDYLHTHNINGVDYMPHIHISAPLNQKGQPIGREIVLPWG